MTHFRFVDEYRDKWLAEKYVAQIRKITTRPWKIMEACGGQTHSIVKYGIDQILPSGLTLVHGPGCPVCVTPVSMIDGAIELALRPDVILCTFSDMLRVPGSKTDLSQAKASGAKIRPVYSPLESIKIAKENPHNQIVFFAVGFETTAPANAMAVFEASRQELKNFSLLVSQVLVPPALEAILKSPNCEIDGFLAPGHVCTIVGYQEYETLSSRYKVPIVVTGFEPGDILQGIVMCVSQLESANAYVENQYCRSVIRDGNEAARKMIAEIFEISPRHWRGIGLLPESGLRLRKKYEAFCAQLRFGLQTREIELSNGCRSGEILQGLIKPDQCPAFGKSCTPEKPMGATMVSSEGACAAYYRYRRNS